MPTTILEMALENIATVKVLCEDMHKIYGDMIRLETELRRAQCNLSACLNTLASRQTQPPP